MESTAALGRGRRLAASERMRKRRHRQATYICLTKDHTYIYIIDNNSVFNTANGSKKRKIIKKEKIMFHIIFTQQSVIK